MHSARSCERSVKVIAYLLIDLIMLGLFGTCPDVCYINLKVSLSLNRVYFGWFISFNLIVIAVKVSTFVLYSFLIALFKFNFKPTIINTVLSLYS